MAVVSLYMAEAGLLVGLELVVRLVLVLVHVLQEVQSQGQREWMRKIGVDHNRSGGNISESVDGVGSGTLAESTCIGNGGRVFIYG